MFLTIDVLAQQKKYDKNGCCTSCGAFWCPYTYRCEYEKYACTSGYQSGCSYTYNSSIGKFHYNLSSLTLDDSFYQVADAESSNFTLIFNFCQTIDPLYLTPACVETTGFAGESCSDPAMAYVESDVTINTCYRLTNCFNSGPIFEIGLLDPRKPGNLCIYG